MLTKEQFLLLYSTFLFFIVQVTALGGASFISGVPTVSPPSAPSFDNTPVIGFFITFWNFLSWVIVNFTFFFQLMMINSTIAFFGAVILTPFIIVLFWMLIEIIVDLAKGLGAGAALGI